MKRVRLMIVLLVSLFSFNMCVLADSSNFEAYLTMNPDITENRINIALGFAGEEIMAIEGKVSYDSKKLTLVEVEALDNFNVTTSLETEDGKYRTIKILADSDYSFNESNYAILVFEVNAPFKNRKKSDIFLYDYEASGPEKIKYRSKGVIATLDRINISEMNFVVDNITDSTKTKYWLLNHAYIFVIIILVIVLVIGIIFLIPSRRKKEAREKKTEDSIKPENYDPNSSNIKIDKEAIDKIGKVEKSIDMSQAIIVSEDVKPFGDIVGKFDEPSNNEVAKNDVNTFNAQINVFDNRTPDEIKQVASNINNATQVDIKEENKVEAPVTQFDPFNATPNTIEKEIDDKELETLEELPKRKDSVQNNPETEGLTVINPQVFENVEMPKLSENVNISQPNENDDKNNGSNILSIIFLLLLITSLTPKIIFADEGINYQINTLRDAIVGRVSKNESLDYNGDGKVDILDIIETKDLTNCNFENLLSTDPGFAEIYGKSNNLISTDSNFVRPTKKSSGKKTTTKKESSGNSKDETTRRTTTRKDSSSGFADRTTKERTTTQGNQERTTRGTTIRTTRSTNTRATTTRKTTTAKPVAGSYNVNITASNGTVSPNSFQLQEGRSKSVSLSPNPGYTVDQNGSSCSNVSYSFSSSTRLMLANIKGNASCNIRFVPRSDIKVTLNYYIGHGNSTTTTPSYSYTSKTVSNEGRGVFGQNWSTGVATPKGYRLREQPSCGSYNNGVFSITIPATSTTCKLYFEPNLYNFRVYISGQSSQINTGTYSRVFYDEKKKIEFSAFTLYTNVSCPGGTTSRLTRSGSAPYEYSFYYTHNSTSDAVCTIS